MFKLIKIENGRMNVPSPVYLEVTNSVAISAGEALKLSSGKLAKVSATDNPTYIALGNKSDTDTARTLACIRVEPNQVYETTFSAKPESLAVGSKVTLDSGKQVTATATNGVATIVSLEGASKSGDKVLVRFE